MSLRTLKVYPASQEIFLEFRYKIFRIHIKGPILIFSAGAFSQSVESLKEFIIEDRLSNGDGEDLLLLHAPAQVETGAFAELQNLKKVSLGLKCKSNFCVIYFYDHFRK